MVPYDQKHLVRCSSSDRGKAYDDRLSGRLYRLQKVREGMSGGSRACGEQCGPHRLHQMHQLRKMQGKLPERLYFEKRIGRKSERESGVKICFPFFGFEIFLLL